MTERQDDDFLTVLEGRFAECLPLAGDERARYMEALAREHPAQAEALGELLVAAEAKDPRMATAGAAGALTGLDPSSGEPPDPEGFEPGSRIGSFVLVETIGEGGMATVYRARRDTADFHQEVAIKVLKHVVGSTEGVARFERERRIVAGLDHPNIAGLIDGGLTPDGRPYVALELVEGEPIDRYCDRHRLPVAERARLAVDIARALQTAHQNLVVHRDLKPSNVLVDTSGRVRLLDFGIAKELAADSHEPVTHLGSRPMTPIYASPEQLCHGTVTTASDQYQLGLLLFELLTGQCHHLLDGTDAVSIHRRVGELETPRPSRLLASRETIATSSGAVDRRMIADRRAATVDELIQDLRSDLDWIVLKTLAKDPEQRYSSLAALAEDLERFLADRPIAARPPSRVYLASKWIRSHRSEAAFAILALAALLGGAAVATWQAVRATRSQQLASAEAATARQVSDFLIDLFEVSDPENARGDELSAKQLLERGRLRIETELADQPLIQARMMGKIAQIHRKLGMYEEALPLAERSLEQLQHLLGPTHPETIRSLRELATSYAESGDDDRAEGLVARAIELLEGGRDEHELARAHLDQAAICFRRADLDRAEALYSRAQAVLSRDFGDDAPELAPGLAGLATVSFARGELQEAEALRRRVLMIYEQRFGDGHPEVARALSELADTLGWQGRDQEAAPLHERAVQVLEKVYGPEHPAVADGLNHLAALYGRMGHLQEAQLAFERSAEIHDKVFGAGHPKTIADSLNLGRVYSLNGEMEKARDNFERAVEAATSHLGQSHPLGGFAYSELARLHRDLGELELAAAGYGKAFEILERALGPEHPRLAETLAGLAFVEAEHGQLERAEALYRRALGLQEKAYGPGKPPLGGPLDGLGSVLRRQGRLAEAKAAHRRAYDAWADAYGPDHPATGASLGHLAEVLLAEGDVDGAGESFRRALDIATRAHGEGHLETLLPLEGLAEVARRQGQPAEALDLLRRATRIRTATYGAGHPSVVAHQAALQRLEKALAAASQLPAG